MTGGAPIVAGLGGVLLFLAAGRGLVELLPAFRERPRAARLGWSYLFGVASVAGAAYVMGAVFDVQIRRSVVLAPVVLLVLGGLASRVVRGGRARPRAPSLYPPRPGVLAARAIFTISALITVGLLAAALTQSNIGYDGEMTWNAAARWVRADRSVTPRALTDPRVYVTHPQYPLLMPVAQVVVQEAFDAGDDRRATKPLYAAFFPALLVVLFDLSRRHAGTLSAALTTLALACIPFLTVNDFGGADGTFSDVPMGAFFGAGFLLLLGHVRRSEAIAAGILLGAGVLTKNEGLPFAAAALLAASFLAFLDRPARKRRRLVALGIAAAAVLAAALVLRAWQSRIPQRWDEDYAGRLGTVSLLQEARARLPLVPVAIAKEMGDRQNLAGFGLAGVVILAAGAGGLRRRIVPPILLCLYFCFGAYVLALLLTTWPGVEQVHPTWDRFLTQTSLPASLLLALALREGWRAVLAIRRSSSPREPIAPSTGPARPASPIRGRLAFLGFAVLPVLSLSVAVTFARGKAPARARAAGTEAAAAPAPTLSPWKEDAALTGGVDEPAEGATVRGRLDVRGWARFAGENLSVAILIDGDERPFASRRRLSRPDVRHAIPSLGDCASAGYEFTYSFSAEDAGPHELQVIFQSGDGRERHYPVRRFTWDGDPSSR